jgi:hypothetical protein
MCDILVSDALLCYRFCKPINCVLHLTTICTIKFLDELSMVLNSLSSVVSNKSLENGILRQQMTDERRFVKSS